MLATRMPLKRTIDAYRGELLSGRPRKTLVGLLFGAAVGMSNASIDSERTFSDGKIRSPADLEYGTVLFEYFQQNYFFGLVEHEYVANAGNPRALNAGGQLLKGSMALSYGLADPAQSIFNTILDNHTADEIRNRAWYHLGKLYHSQSRPDDALGALQNIAGRVPTDLHLDYYYLTTLVDSDAANLASVQQAVTQIPSSAPRYPYLVFNLGVSYLARGDQQASINQLTRVASYAGSSEELQVLADRARHGLAQIAIQEQRMAEAWRYLQDIRTEGLYSNRALLAYAWTAIRQELYGMAIPALQLLNRRSIALPEVQECKVLLGHLYEQQGRTTSALRSYLEAEAEFIRGIELVNEARRIVDSQTLPREFIDNLEAIVDDSGRQAAGNFADYAKLAPFLVDLMASNAFSQITEELESLYTIRDNLTYWANQTEQHQIILDNAAEKKFDDEMRQLLETSRRLHRRLVDQRQEAGLMTLTLNSEDQARFAALLENSKWELALLSDKITTLQKRSEPYRQPPEHRDMVGQHHGRIAERRQETARYIARLEPSMRQLMILELDKHEQRMNYYLAQTRLAKARIYDTALMRANKPIDSRTDSNSNGGGAP